MTNPPENEQPTAVHPENRYGGSQEGFKEDRGTEGEEERRGPKRYTQMTDRNRCRFTRAGVERIDYKDLVTLQKLVTNQGKIFSRKRSGNAARYQRMVNRAIKQARYMALLSYVG
jgi:small subunit ribosomal protein S18